MEGSEEDTDGGEDVDVNGERERTTNLYVVELLTTTRP